MADADGESGRERPGPRFDPVAGMRAMAEIQAEGLRAAGELLERMVGSEPDGARPRPRSPSGEYAALVDAWTDLLRRTASALARPAQPGALTVALDGDGVAPPVSLAWHGPESAAAELWLHNGTYAAIGPLALSCGPLADAAGTVLEGAEVRFEPHEVEALPARSSRAVAVSLAAGGRLRPGVYRGTVQAAGAPRLWVPLEVTVGPW